MGPDRHCVGTCSTDEGRRRDVGNLVSKSSVGPTWVEPADLASKTPTVTNTCFDARANITITNRRPGAYCEPYLTYFRASLYVKASSEAFPLLPIPLPAMFLRALGCAGLGDVASLEAPLTSRPASTSSPLGACWGPTPQETLMRSPTKGAPVRLPRTPEGCRPKRWGGSAASHGANGSVSFFVLTRRSGACVCICLLPSSGCTDSTIKRRKEWA